mgnify:CR=1 FL=1
MGIGVGEVARRGGTVVNSTAAGTVCLFVPAVTASPRHPAPTLTLLHSHRAASRTRPAHQDQEALLAELAGAQPPAIAAAAATAAAAGRLLQPAVPHLDVPLAGGRRARALTWLAAGAGSSSGSSSGNGVGAGIGSSSGGGGGAASLLVLAAPYPEPGLEEGEGDVLVQVRVCFGGMAHGSQKPKNQVLRGNEESSYCVGRSAFRQRCHT